MRPTSYYILQLEDPWYPRGQRNFVSSVIDSSKTDASYGAPAISSNRRSLLPTCLPAYRRRASYSLNVAVCPNMREELRRFLSKLIKAFSQIIADKEVYLISKQPFAQWNGSPKAVTGTKVVQMCVFAYFMCYFRKEILETTRKTYRECRWNDIEDVRHETIEKFNMDWNAECGQLNQAHGIADQLINQWMNQSIFNVNSVVRTQMGQYRMW